MKLPFVTDLRVFAQPGAAEGLAEPKRPRPQRSDRGTLQVVVRTDETPTPEALRAYAAWLRGRKMWRAARRCEREADFLERGLDEDGATPRPSTT